MAKLDIIVTHYNEPVSLIERFLDSVDIQYAHFKDLEVTIVDDGFDCPDISPAYSPGRRQYKVIHLKKEHKTVSAARNYGLDHTTSPYLMFCDCDDMFDSSNPAGLNNVMWKIEANDLSIYRSLFRVEAWKKNLGKQLSALYKADDTDELVTVCSQSINPSVVHAKIYRRSFIAENNIRFNEDLWMNEDGSFNNIAYELCEIKKLNKFSDCEFFYIWKYNEKSVTRQNKIYPVKGFDQFLIASADMHRLIINIGDKERKKKNAVSIAKTAYQAYYWLYLYADRFIGMPEFDECMKVDLVEVKRFYEEFKDYINEQAFENDDMKKYMFNLVRRLDKCDVSKKASIGEWLTKMV